jgi:hypothetical protein
MQSRGAIMKFSTETTKAHSALLTLALGALLATTPGCGAGDVEEDSALGGDQETVAEEASALSPAYWNGHHYIFFAEPNTWGAAKERCASKGHYLIHINNQAEQDWLEGILYPEGGAWWIGYSRNSAGNFHWVNGAYGYTNWAPGEPNDANNNEDCTVIRSWNGLWNDLNCSAQRPYICERDY